MKETIYTIPLTEALGEKCDCAFCYLEDKLEREQVEYTLGPAMMEPDFRDLTNEKGFCRRHTEKLAKGQKALPFSLVLETRSISVINLLEQAAPKTKKGLFSKEKSGSEQLRDVLKGIVSTCLICERIEKTLLKFLKTFWYLYDKEADFREKVLLGNGYCLRHFSALLETADEVKGAKKEIYVKEIYDLEMGKLIKTKDDIQGFIKQFDYRSDKENWDVPKDAHFKCAEKLSGSFERE